MSSTLTPKRKCRFPKLSNMPRSVSSEHVLNRRVRPKPVTSLVPFASLLFPPLRYTLLSLDTMQSCRRVGTAGATDGCCGCCTIQQRPCRPRATRQGAGHASSGGGMFSHLHTIVGESTDKEMPYEHNSDIATPFIVGILTYRSLSISYFMSYIVVLAVRRPGSVVS